jgi:hypothetical protein
MGERGAYRVLVGQHEGKNHFEDSGIDGRIILRWILRSGMEGMGWIDMAQNMYRCRALVNAVTNLRVPQNVANFLTS